MTNYTIYVPKHLIFENTIDFINSFKNLRDKPCYTFDFKNLSLIDAFSILLLSSEINIFRTYNPESKFYAKNTKHCTYAGHMGFFRSFGVDFGNFPGEAKNNNRYMPLEIYDVKAILDEAKSSRSYPGEILDCIALEISNILTQDTNDNLSGILRYCIREIMRNIVEHSDSSQFGLTAQYLPSLRKVSFSVLDRGIGIKESLSENPNLSMINDLEAIMESLKPGISGKTYPGKKRKQKGEWANSGYGLYMTSNICKMGGSFFIASGGSGLYLSGKRSKNIEVQTVGTALNLTIDLELKNSIKKLLEELSNKVPKSNKIKASKSSMDFD